jgi:hypothetical protein
MTIAGPNFNLGTFQQTYTMNSADYMLVLDNTLPISIDITFTNLPDIVYEGTSSYKHSTSTTYTLSASSKLNFLFYSSSSNFKITITSQIKKSSSDCVACFAAHSNYYWNENTFC